MLRKNVAFLTSETQIENALAAAHLAGSFFKKSEYFDGI